MSTVFDRTPNLTFNSARSYIGIQEAGLIITTIKSERVNNAILSLMNTYHTTLITSLVNLKNGHYLAKTAYLNLFRNEAEQ
jgi:hypothetical protein